MSGNNSNTQPGGLAQIIASVQQVTQDFARMSSSAQMFNARMRSLSLEVRGPRTRSFEHLPLYRDVPPDIQSTVESLLAKQKASGKALAAAATAFAQGLIQWVEQTKQRQSRQKLHDAGNQSHGLATGQRAVEASRLTNLAQSYRQLADNNNQIAATWRETGGEMSDDYQRYKLMAESATAIAEELQRRAFILTTAAESNYLQLIFKQYGEDNPDIDKIAAYYAEKFNDQATLAWANLQHPAPRPRLDIPGTVIMLLSAATEEAGGIFQAATEAEESGFEKASDIEEANPSAKTPIVPENVTKTLDTIDKTGAPPQGYVGGIKFENDGRGGGQILPPQDTRGNPLVYKEWDTKPKVSGVNRGAERLVTGNDGSAYYTSDHYHTFTKIR